MGGGSVELLRVKVTVSSAGEIVGFFDCRGG
jgi:hypothetical protein